MQDTPSSDRYGESMKASDKARTIMPSLCTPTTSNMPC